MEKYKKILRGIISQGWDKNQWDFSDDVCKSQEEFENVIWWAVENDIFNSNMVIMAGNRFLKFSGDPLTPYGEEWLKSEFEKIKDVFKKSFWEETGRKSSNLICGVVGIGIGLIIPYIFKLLMILIS